MPRGHNAVPEGHGNFRHPEGDTSFAPEGRKPRQRRGARFNPAFFLSMRKKAPLTVERKNGKGGVSILPLCNPL